MADLRTEYMGIELEHPFIVGASAMSKTCDGVKKLRDAGAAAVVLKSLFEEQIEHEFKDISSALSGGTHPEALEYLISDLASSFGPRDYLHLIEKSVHEAGVPVFASVNCVTPGKWVQYAKQVEAAGAAGIELNVHRIPTDAKLTAGAIEKQVLDIVSAVVAAVRIPVAVKLSHFYTNLTAVGVGLGDRGAKGLVLFNHLFHPDINLEQLSFEGGLELSSPRDYREALRWTGILHGRSSSDLCASGGVHDGRTAAKLILAGASAVQVVSALYLSGAGRLEELKAGLAAWMDSQGIGSIGVMKGRLSLQANEDSDLLLRAQYIKAFTGVE